jgi:hypothetical protein
MKYEKPSNSTTSTPPSQVEKSVVSETNAAFWHPVHGLVSEQKRLFQLSEMTELFQVL